MGVLQKKTELNLSQTVVKHWRVLVTAVDGLYGWCYGIFDT